MANYHSTTERLAALATKAKPGLLIVYHSSITWRPDIALSGNQSFVISAGTNHSSSDVLDTTWLFAGLRSNEIVRLRVGCVRWQKDDVTVPGTGDILPAPRSVPSRRSG